MAKTIKKIVCPQCGSNKVNEVKADYYLCESCKTNFFLDTDDITINHKINNTRTNKEHLSIEQSKKVAKIVSIFVGVFVLYLVGSAMFRNDKNTVDTHATTSEGSAPTATKENARTISPDYKLGSLVQLKDGSVVLVSVITFKDVFANGDGEQLYVVQYDPATGKEINRTKLKVDLSIKGAGRRGGSPIQLFTSANDELYLIVNNYFLYRFDKGQKKFVVVDHTFFDPYKEFSDGVASLEYQDYSDALIVLTNMGKKYAFYPAIKTVLLSDKSSNVYTLALPEPVVETKYKFSEESRDFPDESIQLITYNVQTQKGYPQYDVTFHWGKDFGGSGIFTDKSPYKKRLLTDYQQERAKIVSYKDFTPNRNYVKGGKVLGQDEEGVIIAIKMTILENETYTIQKLKLTDGSILWTKKTDWDSVREVNKVGDLIMILADSYQAVMLNMSGEIVSTVDMNGIRLEATSI
ncbi:MAG: hypothetical protein LBI72_11410 [Flavobacteriaceae bacterium]|jgi:hypothetical protein|nr:hypothetical protein [Flavobacteriaceae bacterium]